MKALRRFGQLALELLRELADENAYRRHLEAHGRAHSRAKYARAKCC